MMIKNLPVLVKSNKIRYLIVGGASFATEFLVFAFLNHFHVQIFIANTLSFIVSFTMSFILHRLWSFAGEHKHAQARQLAAYLTLALCNLVLTNVLIGIFVNWIGIAPLIAKLLCIIAIVIWNYAIMSKIIFQKITQEGQI